MNLCLTELVTIIVFIAAIQESKTRGLDRLIFALGIRHVGFETAKLLARRFPSLAALGEAGVEELAAVEGIGPVIAESVAAWFTAEQNRRVIERLRDVGIDPRHERREPEGPRPLDGLSFILTGTLSSLTREAAEERIRALGGQITSGVNKKTSYIIVGEKPGSKLEKAEKLGTPQLTEEALVRMLEDARPPEAG